MIIRRILAHLGLWPAPEPPDLLRPTASSAAGRGLDDGNQAHAVAEGTPEEIVRNPVVEKAYLFIEQ